MNQFSIIVNNIKFNISCQTPELYEEQQKIFRKFVPQFFDEDDYVCEYNIVYSNKNASFNKISSLILGDDYEILTPYMNERMYKNEKDRYTSFLRENRDFCAISHKNGIYIIVANPNAKTSKYAPYVLLMELMQKTREEIGDSLFHSTGIALNNNGIFIVGQSGSGKTTLMSKFCQCRDVNFLSNDRVLVTNDLKMKSFPLEIILSMGTVKFDPYLKDYFITKSKSENWFGTTLENTSNNKKCGIKPCELESIYPKLKLIKEHGIDLIILPKINFAKPNSLSIQKIEQEQILKLLQECCFTPNDRESPRKSWIKEHEKKYEQLVEQSELTIKLLSQKIPILLVDYGCDISGQQILQELGNQFAIGKEAAL